eukprot:m.35398 g.35398  ORF g.35398 m.35398 type:complete len:420 (+) comp10012_c0_seq1:186-1445(+)
MVFVDDAIDCGGLTWEVKSSQQDLQKVGKVVGGRNEDGECDVNTTSLWSRVEGRSERMSSMEDGSFPSLIQRSDSTAHSKQQCISSDSSPSPHLFSNHYSQQPQKQQQQSQQVQKSQLSQLRLRQNLKYNQQRPSLPQCKSSFHDNSSPNKFAAPIPTSDFRPQQTTPTHPHAHNQQFYHHSSQYHHQLSCNQNAHPYYFQQQQWSFPSQHRLGTNTTSCSRLSGKTTNQQKQRKHKKDHQQRSYTNYCHDGGDDVRDGLDLLKNYLYHKYTKFLARALNERRLVGYGNSPLVSSLYQFWFSRLQHKFNRNMYQTFLAMAVEDTMYGKSREGMEYLFRFLRVSLAITFRDKVFKDFVQLVSDDPLDERFGLEQLWLFLRECSDEIRQRTQDTLDRKLSSHSHIIATFNELDRFHALSLD